MGMRGNLKGESALKKQLKQVASQVKPESLAFKEFDGKLPPAATAKLFRRAAAVVGVHGGALSNMIFCSKDVKIFEIGFFTPFAGHYRHLAAALGLELTMIPLAVNERGLGANEVRVENAENVVDVIRKSLVKTSEARSAVL